MYPRVHLGHDSATEEAKETTFGTWSGPLPGLDGVCAGRLAVVQLGLEPVEDLRELPLVQLVVRLGGTDVNSENRTNGW